MPRSEKSSSSPFPFQLSHPCHCMHWSPQAGQAMLDALQRKEFCEKKKETRTIFIGKGEHAALYSYFIRVQAYSKLTRGRLSYLGFTGCSYSFIAYRYWYTATQDFGCWKEAKQTHVLSLENCPRIKLRTTVQFFICGVCFLLSPCILVSADKSCTEYAPAREPQAALRAWRMLKLKVVSVSRRLVSLPQYGIPVFYHQASNPNSSQLPRGCRPFLRFFAWNVFRRRGRLGARSFLLS